MNKEKEKRKNVGNSGEEALKETNYEAYVNWAS